MSSVERITETIDTVSDFTGRLASWLAVPMIGALVYEVVARYIFHRPTIWSYEVTYMIYGTHYLLGAAYTLRVRGHIRIDFIYMKFSPRGRAIIDIVGYLVVFFPIMIVMIYGTFDLVREAYVLKEVSQFSPWQPILWPFKSVIFAGFVLLTIQGVAEFIRSVMTAVRGVEA